MTLTQLDLLSLSLPYFDFAQSNILLTGGKYSASIIRPGIPKTHPWKMGINPPINPMITNKKPNVILMVCRI